MTGLITDLKTYGKSDRGAPLLKIIDNILLVRRGGELNGKFFTSKQFFAVASLQIYTHFRKKSYFWVGQEMGGDSVGFTSHQKHSSTVQVYAICYILRGSFFPSDSEKLQSSGENSDYIFHNAHDMSSLFERYD